MKPDPKEEKLEQVKKELNEKIVKIMGPVPNDLNEEGSELYKQDQKPEPAAPDEPKQGAPKLPAKEAAKPEPKPKEPAPEEPKPEAPEEPAITEPEEDPKTDQLVDEIAEEESNELLAAEDAEVEKAFVREDKKTLGTKLKDFFAKWWGNKVARWTTIIGIIALVLGLAVYPTTRYFLLNTVGIRSKASLTVLDDSTQQPLKNVQIKIGSQTATTNEQGVATLEKLKLGRTSLVVERRAFATIDRTITLGFGSNPLGEFKLEPTGIQYAFIVKDFLSGKPVVKAEAVSGDASAFSDKDGKILLTLDKNDAQTATEASISLTSYRKETVALGDAKDTQTIKMVPAQKHAFVTKRSGKYDVYKIDADGKNEELVLAGTGSERDDMVLIPQSVNNKAALVSTRENVHNKEGFLLSTLTLIDLNTNESKSLGSSERFYVVGWVGDNLVYVQIAAGASAGNPKRHRLLSYNPKAAEIKELAYSNYFNDVLAAAENIYYAPSAAYQTGAEISLFKVGSGGGVRQTLLNKEVWNIFRTDYDHLIVSVGQDWYEYKFGDTKLNKAANAPASPKNRVYIDSPDKKHSLWIEDRDGKGVLLSYDINGKKDVVLKTTSGIKYPAQWLSDTTLVYRINTDQETADYVLNIEGGEPQKIRDVTNTGGIDQWYYY